MIREWALSNSLLHVTRRTEELTLLYLRPENVIAGQEETGYGTLLQPGVYVIELKVIHRPASRTRSTEKGHGSSFSLMAALAPLLATGGTYV
jgi:hypothetical protein